MRPGRWIGLTLALWALVEIAVFAVLQNAVGITPILILCAVTAAIGVLAVRRAGDRAWAALRQAAEQPATQPSLSNAGVVFAGGLLLIVPGLVSDVLGLLCLIPFTRPLLRRLGRAAFPSVARYQDTTGLLRAQMDRDSVVEGSVDEAAGPSATNGPQDPPPNQIVIEGEIEP